jgi:hypothetical protein
MRRILALLTLLLALPALAQSTRVLQGDYVSNVFSLSNFIRNPNAQLNTSNVIVGGSAAITRSVTTPLLANSEFNVTSVAANATFTWAIRPLDAGLRGQNCEARFRYRGFQTTSKAQVLQGINVIAEVALVPSVTDPRVASLNFPCGDLSTTTTFRITDTAALAGTNEIGGIYLGQATNLSNLSQSEFVGSTELNTCGSVFTVTSTTFAALPNVASCNLNNFGAATTTAKDHSVLIPNAKPGVYFVKWNGVPYVDGAVNRQCYFSLQASDPNGVIYTGGTAYVGVQTSDTVARGAGQLAFEINSTTTRNLTFRVVAKASSGACNVDSSGAVANSVLSVYRFPSNSEIAVRPDQVAQYGAVRFSGGTMSIPQHGGVAEPSGFAAVNSSTIPSRRTLIGSCAAPTTSSGEDLGCSIPNMPVGEWRVQVRGVIRPTNNNTYASQCAFRIFETTTSTETGVQTESIVLGAGGIGEFYQGYVNGRFYNPSVATRNFVLQSNKTTDTDPGNAGSCQTFMKTDGAPFTDILFEVIPVTQSSPAPLLAGSVTSNSSGLERVERAHVAGTTRDTRCTSSPCAVVSQSGNWLTVTRTSTGLYTLNFTAGTFSSAPSCSINGFASGVSDTMVYAYYAATSTAASVVSRNVSGVALLDSSFDVTCQGPR